MSTVPRVREALSAGDPFADWERLTGSPFAATWRDFVYPQDWLRFAREHKRALSVGRFTLEYKLRMVSGDYRQVRGFADRWVYAGVEKWWGYIMPIEEDHEHVCMGHYCYCVNVLI